MNNEQKLPDTESLAGQEWKAPAAPAAPELAAAPATVPGAPTLFFAALDEFKQSDQGASAAQRFADKVLLSSPAERQEADTCGKSERMAEESYRAHLASPASAEPVLDPNQVQTIADRIRNTSVLAAPSSPSVSGTVDTPELSELVIQIKKYPMLSGPMNDLIAHIEELRAQAEVAAREEALEEAESICLKAANCDLTHEELAHAIRSKRTPQAAGTEQEKKQ